MDGRRWVWVPFQITFEDFYYRHSYIGKGKNFLFPHLLASPTNNSLHTCPLLIRPPYSIFDLFSKTKIQKSDFTLTKDAPVFIAITSFQPLAPGSVSNYCSCHINTEADIGAIGTLLGPVAAVSLAVRLVYSGNMLGDHALEFAAWGI